MGKKLVKCKVCGGEVAKSAKTCPHCGARQNQGVYAACAVIVAIAVFVCTFIIISAIQEGESAEGESGNTSISESSGSSATQLVFEGTNAKVTYISVSEAAGVSGCFYLNLQIENTGDTEEVIYVTDVYVDDLACTSGTGLPVVIAPGKKANGAFIIFYDGSLSDVNEIEYKITIANNETLDIIETSSTIQLNL